MTSEISLSKDLIIIDMKARNNQCFEKPYVL